jgi:hypothetical protein
MRRGASALQRVNHLWNPVPSVRTLCDLCGRPLRSAGTSCVHSEAPLEERTVHRVMEDVEIDDDHVRPIYLTQGLPLLRLLLPRLLLLLPRPPLLPPPPPSPCWALHLLGVADGNHRVG